MKLYTAVQLFGPDSLAGHLSEAHANLLNDLTYNEDDGTSFALGNQPACKLDEVKQLLSSASGTDAEMLTDIVGVMEAHDIDMIV